MHFKAFIFLLLALLCAVNRNEGMRIKLGTAAKTDAELNQNGNFTMENLANSTDASQNKTITNRKNVFASLSTAAKKRQNDEETADIFLLDTCVAPIAIQDHDAQDGKLKKDKMHKLSKLINQYTAEVTNGRNKLKSHHGGKAKSIRKERFDHGENMRPDLYVAQNYKPSLLPHMAPFNGMLNYYNMFVRNLNHANQGEIERDFKDELNEPGTTNALLAPSNYLDKSRVTPLNLMESAFDRFSPNDYDHEREIAVMYCPIHGDFKNMAGGVDGCTCRLYRTNRESEHL